MLDQHEHIAALMPIAGAHSTGPRGTDPPDAAQLFLSLLVALASALQARAGLGGRFEPVSWLAGRNSVTAPLCSSFRSSAARVPPAPPPPPLISIESRCIPELVSAEVGQSLTYLGQPWGPIPANVGAISCNFGGVWPTCG